MALGHLMTYNHYISTSSRFQLLELDNIVKSAWLAGALGAS